MARKRPVERGESRAHEAAESPEFERGEEEEAKELKGTKAAVVKHLTEDSKEGQKHAAKDAALAKRVKKGK